jgi:hypothetical protein
MATHPPKRAVVFRNFSLSIFLDLFLLRFCSRENLNRSEVFQHALLQFLMYHAPDLKPDCPIEDMIRERWGLKGTGRFKGVKNGPSKATVEESRAMQLYQLSKEISTTGSEDVS